MAASEVLGEVADRLVEGMMLHSDHADLMCFLGLRGLKRLHECGYHDDAKRLRKVHRLGIKYTQQMVPQGRQSASDALEPYMRYKQSEVDADTRRTALMDAMAGWVEYEADTAKLFSRAARDLWGMGEGILWVKVFALQKEAEHELATARKLHDEMAACGYDMCHVMEMQDPLHKRYRNPCER